MEPHLQQRLRELTDRGDYTEALALVTAVLQAMPDDQNALNWAARLSAKQGLHRQAFNYFLKAAKETHLAP